jgi:lipopolysaccharide transport system ATP-binding protein
MNAVIKAENLGKKYIIGHQKQRYGATLRDTMTHTARGIWQRMRHPLSPNRESIDLEELWALKGVNFEVQQGERIGIIGANGAGKSTLLKVLSRITEPTTGKVRIKGRVSSLLEVGTGFHPELTGRENIFLNGAILGMTRQEVKGKFDEIVAFAELEKFLDTPVKRYSSGMYVRLAFAVAAHLEPEILIVDEVLAVGDAAFKKKCLGKMDDVARGGRTILLVSHNMAAVQNLCERILLIANGRIEIDGTSDEAISSYLQAQPYNGDSAQSLSVYRQPGYEPIIQEIVLINGSGQVTDRVQSGGELTIQLEYSSPVRLRTPTFGIGVDTIEGQRLFFLQTKLQYGVLKELSECGVIRCRVPLLPLAPGTYSLSIGCSANGKQLDRLERVVRFHVVETDYYNTGFLPKPNQGRVLVGAEWTFSE